MAYCQNLIQCTVTVLFVATLDVVLRTTNYDLVSG